MAKMTARDKVILKLKEEIEEQKAALESVSKSKYRTNLVLPITGNRINLNTLDKSQILVYIAQLANIRTGLVSLGISDEPDLGGFTIEDWVHDLRIKYGAVNRRNEEKRLSDLEDKLNALLSEDVKKDKELADVLKSMGKK